MRRTGGRSAVCWGTVAALLAAGTLTYPVLLAVAVAASAVNGFLSPASDAMLRSIVSVRDYPKARSMNEGRDAAVNMGGSPLGGFLFAIAPWPPFLASCVMYAAAGVAGGAIHRPARPRRSHGARGTLRATIASFAGDFREGWAWSLRKRTLLVVMVVSALLNFGVNGFQYAIQLHLMASGEPSTAIGFLDTGVCVAMLLGAFVAGKVSERAPVGPVVCWGVVAVCAVGTVLVCVDGYWAVLVANSLMCVPFPVINALLLGFVFAKTPDAMQGRVGVTLGVPAQALSMFCSATAGSLLPAIGYRATMLVFLAVLGASAVAMVCYRPLRSIPKADGWDAAELR
ncbi:MAG: MFS transporter [Bifidobacterium sp.]|nr:MFS transporter [Bifidobacterium sp.]